MAKIVINAEKCKCCELCIGACPQGLISVSEARNASGDHFAEQRSSEKCTGCRLCAIMCPDMCIEVYK